MVTKYYACLSRHTVESDALQRDVLEFEVVEEQYLSFFLDGKEPRGITEYPSCQQVYQKFLQYGATDPRFQEVKSNYLGDTDPWAVSVYFNHNSRWGQYIYENWYSLWLSDTPGELEDDGLEYALYRIGQEDEEIQLYGNLRHLPTEQARLLKQLYEPYIPPIQAEKAEGKELQNSIYPYVRFEKITFYYVGAALHIRIFDETGRLAAIFDLGTRVARRASLVHLQAPADASKAEILDLLRSIDGNNPVTIFISHWHIDHYNALGILWNESDNFIKLCQNAEWYVPHSGTPMFMRVQKRTPPSKFHVYSGEQQPQKVAGNEYIEVGKIDFKGNPHPHHQGLFVRLQFSNGRNILLPGDTTYEGLPLNVRNGRKYSILQVCHHGGNYSIYPATQGSASQQFIPMPTKIVENYAVYSADGVSHRHPNLTYVTYHRNRGYLEKNEVCLHMIAADGYNKMEFEW